jgi:hypothetical protein
VGCTASQRRVETLSALHVEGRDTLRLAWRYDTIVHEKQLRDTLFALHGMAFIRLRLALGCWAWHVQMEYNDNHCLGLGTASGHTDYVRSVVWGCYRGQYRAQICATARRQLNGAGLHYARHGQVCMIQSSRYQHLRVVLRCAEADGTSR